MPFTSIILSLSILAKDMGTMPAKVLPIQNIQSQDTHTTQTITTEQFNINFTQKENDEVQSKMH